MYLKQVISDLTSSQSKKIRRESWENQDFFIGCNSKAYEILSNISVEDLVQNDWVSVDD